MRSRRHLEGSFKKKDLKDWASAEADYMACVMLECKQLGLAPERA